MRRLDLRVIVLTASLVTLGWISRGEAAQDGSDQDPAPPIELEEEEFHTDDARANPSKLAGIEREIERYETLITNDGAPREWFFHLGELRELRRKLIEGEIDPEDPLVVRTPEGGTAVLSPENEYRPAYLVGSKCREVEITPVTRAKAELDRIGARLTSASSLERFVGLQLLESDLGDSERVELKSKHDALVKEVDRLTAEYEAASKKLSVVKAEFDRVRQACSDPAEEEGEMVEAGPLDDSEEPDPLAGRVCTPGEEAPGLGEATRVGPEAMVVSTEDGGQGRDVDEIRAEIDRSREALEDVEKRILRLQRRFERAEYSWASTMDAAGSLEPIGEEMERVEDEIVASVARARGRSLPASTDGLVGFYGLIDVSTVSLGQERIDLREELPRLRTKSPASARAIKRLIERLEALALEYHDVNDRIREAAESHEVRALFSTMTGTLDRLNDARDRRDALRKKLAGLEAERARLSPSPRAETSGLEPACVADDELPGGVLSGDV